MKLKITNPFWQVVGLGLLAGMRSAAAPAIASHVLSRRQLKSLHKRKPGSVVPPDQMSLALRGLAIADFITDRPSKGKIVKPFSLVSRCVSGSLVGAGIYKAAGGNVIAGSIVGGITALGASLGTFYLRRDNEGRKYVMDPVINALEDALVIGAGISVIREA